MISTEGAYYNIDPLLLPSVSCAFVCISPNQRAAQTFWSEPIWGAAGCYGAASLRKLASLLVVCVITLPTSLHVTC